MNRPDLWRWPVPTAQRYPTPKAALHLTAEDFLQLALGAYYVAVRAMQPPAGERWLPEPDGVPWSCPENLHNDLLHQLGERLWAHAAATGHLDGVENPGCRGGAPAVEGHGCPALASAVGSALTPSPAADITTSANPLLCGQQVQELPGRADPATVTQHGEDAPC